MTDVQGQKGMFPAAPYMSDAKRYKRGYSPGRMAEVRDALMRTQPNGDIIPGTTTSRLSRQSGVHAPELSDSLTEGGKKALTNLHQRGVHEAIARSTIPARALRSSVGSIETDEGKLTAYHAAGLFESQGKRVVVQQMRAGDKRIGVGHQALLKRYPDQARRLKTRQFAKDDDERSTAETLIHELGHARSYNNDSRNMDRRAFPHEQTWSGSEVSGPEEAFADDHAVTHHRQDPREKARGGPKEVHTYLSTGNLTHRNTSYTEARQHLQPGEADLALNDDQLRHHNYMRETRNASAAKAQGDQMELLGHLEVRNLSGRQFGGTPKP